MKEKKYLIDSNDILNTGNKEETTGTPKSNFRSKQTLVGTNYTGFTSGRNMRQVPRVSGIQTGSDYFVLNVNNDNDNSIYSKAKDIFSTTNDDNNDHGIHYDNLCDANNKLTKYHN